MVRALAHFPRYLNDRYRAVSPADQMTGVGGLQPVAWKISSTSALDPFRSLATVSNRAADSKLLICLGEGIAKYGI
jgi:hypothetical protein